MEIYLQEGLARAIGAKALKPYGINDFEQFKWNKALSVDVSMYSTFKVLQLKNLVEPHAATEKGGALALRDLNIYLAAVKDAGKGKPRTVEQFFHLTKAYLQQTPGHRIYQNDTERGVWLPYYVDELEYHPPRRERDHSYPPYVSMDLWWHEFGKREHTRLTFYAEDCTHRPVSVSLGEKGYVVETKEMRAQYVGDMERFNAMVGEVGKQYLARGVGTDNCDGNIEEDEDRWWRARTNTIILDKLGDPARVVVDLFRETDKDEKEREDHMNKWFWHNLARKKHTEDGDAEDEDVLEALDEEDRPDPEVPYHPMLACFDLKRHTRLRIHTRQLTEYVYDAKLGEKLVLPEDDRALIEILLEHKGAFNDIVAGKGGGSIVICTGRPGLGKTLTAEVYAEVAGRPLYTVQCSQLGTEPDDLEDNLLKSFARAERWNAILLLDEADVYVRARGDDLMQNAIVGVFLRVLEYYRGVMFMTTNRPDLVDDAIMSRCLAQLHYEIPEDQAGIWRILSDVLGAKLSDRELVAIVKDLGQMSGRDVKHLLKLAILIGEARGEKVSPKLVKFVKRFKPTIDAKEQANG